MRYKNAFDLEVGLRLSNLLLTLTCCTAIACSSDSQEAAKPKAAFGPKAPAPKTVQAPPAKPTETAPAPGPNAPADEGWIDAAVEEALDSEIMPGTSGEPDLSRKGALKIFFKAHPEYRDADQRAQLWEHACGLDGTEAAHAFITNPPPKKPVEVEVKGDDWRVFVAHASGHCTSDDWGYYSSEANQAATEHGATTAYGNANSDQLIIRKDGKELHRIQLSGQGFIAVRAGQKPSPMVYDPGISGSVARYFSDAQ